MTETIYTAIGPPMRINRGSPFVISGQRFRSSTREVLDLTGLTVRVRIGVVGATALIDSAMTEDDADPADPSYYCTLSAVATAIAAGDGYEYVIADSNGRVLVYGPCSVVDHPRASA